MVKYSMLALLVGHCCTDLIALHKTKTQITAQTAAPVVAEQPQSAETSWNLTKVRLTCTQGQWIALWSVFGVICVGILIRYRKNCKANIHNFWDWVRRVYHTQQERDEKLYRAVEQNKLGDVESWWYRGASVNGFIDIEAPLHKAAACGHEEIARWLLLHGANLHKQDSAGKTPLMCAVQAHTQETPQIVYLFNQWEEQQKREHPAKTISTGITITDNSEETVLAKAVQHPTVVTERCITKLISPENINKQNLAGETPLLALLIPQDPLKVNDTNLRTRIGNVLLANGANIHSTDQSGETALVRAVRLNYPILAKHMLNTCNIEHLAEVEAALFMALRCERWELLDDIFKEAVGLASLKPEHTGKKPDDLKNLYEYKLVQWVIEHGDKPLLEALFAARKPSLERVQWAVWSVLNAAGEQADLIGCLVNVEVNKQRIDLRTKKQGETAQGETALIQAAKRGFTLTAQKILQAKNDYAIQHNACVNLTPDYSTTHARIRLPGISEMIDAQDDRGYTALHYAAERGNNPLVHMLIDAGAEVNLQTFDSKKTAYDLAVEGKHEACKKVLEAYQSSGGSWMAFVR